VSFAEGENVEMNRQAAYGLPVLICVLGFVPALVGPDNLNQPLMIAIVAIAWSFAVMAVYLTAYRPLRRLANDRKTSISRILINGLARTYQDTTSR
jgi:hypothetical protein